MLTIRLPPPAKITLGQLLLPTDYRLAQRWPDRGDANTYNLYYIRKSDKLANSQPIGPRIINAKIIQWCLLSMKQLFVSHRTIWFIIIRCRETRRVDKT